MIDFSKLIGTTAREVEDSERDGRPTHIVRLARLYGTTPGDLWSAMTERERLQRWFAQVSGDLNSGGSYAIKGNASGTILACEPPKLLALTWAMGDNESWVTVRIEQDGAGAKLTLEHEMPSDAHWDKFGPGATGVGWELGLLGLAAHFANPEILLIEEGEAWAASDGGKTVLREWADAWGNAHGNTGISAQSAKEAADRAAAFYTGEA